MTVSEGRCNLSSSLSLCLIQEENSSNAFSMLISCVFLCFLLFASCLSLLSHWHKIQVRRRHPDPQTWLRILEGVSLRQMMERKSLKTTPWHLRELRFMTDKMETRQTRTKRLFLQGNLPSKRGAQQRDQKQPFRLTVRCLQHPQSLQRQQLLMLTSLRLITERKRL